nr:glycosyltransferase [Celeribacter baekdonensis]
MLAQEYPHDTWLADEAPDAQTRAWCDAHGVRISTRQGIADYHRAEWPRRTRCKEGNLAFFYDTWGYDTYDIVCQLDSDHVPQPGYLREMLRPFADPEVGYVPPRRSVPPMQRKVGRPARGFIPRPRFTACSKPVTRRCLPRCASARIMPCAPSP